MARRYQQGFFQMTNPGKYVGSRAPYARSSWEVKTMMLFDTHPNVIQWASEEIGIPYISPVDNRKHTYYPDFMVRYIDGNNQEHVELIEVKPQSQSTLEHARSAADKAALNINAAKWDQARKWCKAKGIKFRIVTENNIFRNKKPRQGSRRTQPR
jgi:hypothetical protein